MSRAGAFVVALALAGCTQPEPNPFEEALGPPPPQTTTSVSVSAGSDGVRVGGAITQTRGNVTVGIGF
ncbi:hypothetical protein SAMN05421759_101223 [Roseivivax lentus]|uniref:Uncharacterized protein n=1 Tax=Roseivivax lentus TaxID=633194 RepID=A0A1N7JUA4_9RHOB|nr:hypothetical protein [Roseivivax lentus]SIS52784.1 hypothetical protein SAMN05421759_101223 [Roseivivax lentus]